jgi:hypothetical protein
MEILSLVSHWSIRTPCASYSQGSGRGAQASYWRLAISVSAQQNARTVDQNSLSPSSLHPVSVGVRASNAQTQVQFAHPDSQVRPSLALAARRALTLRSRQNTPGAASRTTFRAHPTRKSWSPSSSMNSVVKMQAYLSMFASAAQPDLLYY